MLRNISKTIARLFYRNLSQPIQRPCRRPLAIESLEVRRLFATYQVFSTSINENTANTLPWAIKMANASANDADLIEFTATLDIEIKQSDFPNGLPALIGPTRIIGNDSVIRGTSPPADPQNFPEWGLRINELRTSPGSQVFAISDLNFTGFQAAAIYVQQLHSASTLDINFAEIHDNKGLGIWSEAEQKTTIRNSYIHDNTLAGIFINHTGGVSALGNAITANTISRNGDGGIRLLNASNVAISETDTTAGNIFEDNGTGFAISVSQTSASQSVSTGNRISKNTFKMSTGGIPIDLRFENAPTFAGATPNDGNNDSDVGPNTLLNYPVIQSFLLNGTTWTVKGILDTDAANQAAEIQFYKYTAATSTYSYMSSITATLNGSGDWPGTLPSEWQATFTKGSAIGQLNEGDQIAALAIITGTKNTSEMSPTAFAPSDIIVNNFTVDATDPHFLSVNYTINGAALSSFRIGVYRSADNMRVLEYSPTGTELGQGTRSVRIPVDGDFESASDLAQEYTLIARLDDNANQIAESIETNNELNFAGGMFQAPMGTLQVHGGPGATTVDSVTFTPSGSLLNVDLNSITKSFTAAGVPAIHVRTHGGNDAITRGAIDAVMSIWGGDGDDTLTIDGVAVMPTSVSKFDPGAGSNTFTVNKDKVYLNTTPNSKDDALAALTTTVKGGAELQTDRLWQTILTITENSKVKLTADGSFDNPACKLNSLTINAGSTLDINDQALIIDYDVNSPVATIRDRLISGRGGTGLGKLWNGTGITSSAAEAYNQLHPNGRSVGYAENSLLPLGSYAPVFRQVAVDGTCVLIAYTVTGDANLDGIVNDNDVTIVGTFYAPGVPKPDWAKGDFDYNGFVDDDDVTLQGTYYNPSAPPV